MKESVDSSLEEVSESQKLSNEELSISPSTSMPVAAPLLHRSPYPQTYLLH